MPFPFAHVVSFGSSPVILSIPPTAQPFACAKLSPGGSGSFALSCALCPSACCFHQITLPRVTLGMNKPQTFKNQLRFFASSSPQGQDLSFLCPLIAWCPSFVAPNTVTLSDHNAGSVSCSPVSAHRSPTNGGWGGSTQELLSHRVNQCSWTHKPRVLSNLPWMLGLVFVCSNMAFCLSVPVWLEQHACIGA